jgi:hypothetical protein
MPQLKTSRRSIDRRMILSSLWIFAMFNYLYADVMSLMDPGLRQAFESGVVNGSSIRITPIFLLCGAILMETAMLMVILPRILPRMANKVANIAVGILHTLAVAGSMLIGSSVTPHYALCASFEIPTTILIVVLSRSYMAAATESEKAGLAISAQGFLAYFKGTAWFIQTALYPIAGMIFAILMRRSPSFSKADSVVGLIVSALTFGFVLPRIGMLFLFINTIGTIPWYLMIARRLWKISRT